MKFFAQSKVNWNRFRPTDLVFKSNAMVKKIVPSENILSYSTKSDRDVDMARRSGGKEDQKTSWNGQTYTDSGIYQGPTTNCVTTYLDLNITACRKAIRRRGTYNNIPPTRRTNTPSSCRTSVTYYIDITSLR